MNVRWKKLLVRTTIWLFVELWLNFLGLDDVADYSEFIFEKHLIIPSLLTVSLATQQYINGAEEKNRFLISCSNIPRLSLLAPNIAPIYHLSFQVLGFRFWVLGEEKRINFEPQLQKVPLIVASNFKIVKKLLT